MGGVGMDMTMPSPTLIQESASEQSIKGRQAYNNLIEQIEKNLNMGRWNRVL